MTSPFSITVNLQFIDKMSFLCIASCQQCVIDACVSVTCDAKERLSVSCQVNNKQVGCHSQKLIDSPKYSRDPFYSIFIMFMVF